MSTFQSALIEVDCKNNSQNCVQVAKPEGCAAGGKAVCASSSRFTRSFKKGEIVCFLD